MEINDIPDQHLLSGRDPYREIYLRCDGYRGIRPTAGAAARLVYDIVSVQPMTGPSGLVFAMRAKYGK